MKKLLCAIFLCGSFTFATARHQIMVGDNVHLGKDLVAYENGSDTISNSQNPEIGNISVILLQEDFETGWGNWSKGGKDCFLYNESLYAHRGQSAVCIQDNSGVNSSFTLAKGIDASGFSQLIVEFWYLPIEIDNDNEGFLLQYFDGSDWLTIASWINGIDFDNDAFYLVSVIIDANSYRFPSNASFRFICDASDNNDKIYIDEIKIMGCADRSTKSDLELIDQKVIIDIDALEEKEIFSVKVYPVPSNATDLYIDVAGMNSPGKMVLSDMMGKVIRTVSISQGENIISIVDLETGFYIVTINNGSQTFSKQIVVN